MQLSAYDVVWILTCSVLVMLMQAGFCCLESGIVRSKNSINVAAKNYADFCISTAIFWLIGFGLMFGTSFQGIIGTDGFAFSSFQEPSVVPFFIFQMMFCGTATTIISGAVAERTRFAGYLLISIVVSLVIYPVFGHWAWAGVNGGLDGWLATLGFVDFAGGTVVHSVAGWVSLAAVLIIGPRIGRFESPDTKFRSNSLPMATLGVFILWVGWIGFNGGSNLVMDQRVPLIIFNTLLAGTFGGVGAMVVSLLHFHRFIVFSIMNGTLAGLVAITASANSVEPWAAVSIGTIAGSISVYASQALAKFKIDDAIHAFPVHGVGGIWGTIAVALFGDPVSWGTGFTRWQQLSAQSTGVVVAMVWAFGGSYILLRMINHYFPLRVTEDSEHVGLNVSEHEETTDQLDLLRSMEHQRATGNFSRKVPVDVNSDIGDIAEEYNLVLTQLSSAKTEAETANRTKSQFLASMSHELRTPMNAILGFAQLLQHNPKKPLTEDQNSYVESIMIGGRHLLKLINEILDLAKIESGRISLTLEDVDANKAVADCVALITPLGEQDNITIINNINDGPSTFLSTDKQKFKQILINLLSNAVKYNIAGGTVTIKGQETKDGFLQISVTDTGIGIARKDHALVFRMYQRLEKNATISKKDGTGIGLTVSKLLIEQMAGRLGFKSEVGTGSTFWIKLPLVSNENVLVWTDKMSVGIDTIDKDHQVIFSLLNKVAHCGIEEMSLDEIIEELINYTHYHFQREEAIMEVCGYPDLKRHHEMHHNHIAQITNLAEIWRKERDPKLLHKLQLFLRNWLIEHAMKVDTTIAPYAKGKRQDIQKALEELG